MKLRTLSPSNRKIKPSFHTTKEPIVYFAYGLKHYDFILELYDNSSGNKYKIEASQLEWEKLISEIQKKFNEAPA